MLKHPFEQDLHTALQEFDFLVNKDYFNQLNCYPLVPCANCKDCILLFKVNSLTSTTTSSFFTYVFNALASLGTTIGFILNRCNNTLDFYISLRVHSAPHISREILMQGFAATFPPSQLIPLDPTATETLLCKLFSPSTSCALTSAIVIPNTTTTENTPILEKFSSLFPSENFTALFLASPIKPCKIQESITQLVDLFSTLSQFNQSNHSISKGLARNSSCTLTKNHTKTCGDSRTHTDNSGNGNSTACYTNVTPSTVVPLGDSSRSVNISMTLNHATGTNSSDAHSIARGENNSHAHGGSKANMDATNLTNNNTIAYSKQNKAVADALTELTTLITRFSNASNDAFFCFNAFFLAPLISTTIRAGYTYVGLAKDAALNLAPVAINTWPNSDPAFLPLITELQHLRIPRFNLPSSRLFKACATITPSELLNTFYFPFPPSS